MFIYILMLVILQRIIELFVARRNERWMKSKGAIEAGEGHYPFMVAMHIAFFVSLIAEVVFFNRSVSAIWIVWLSLFVIAQVFRVWCLLSLGKYWNTKIIVLPNAEVVRKGPYKWLRHPNYIIVATELIVLPLLFNAYFTALLFTCLNIWMMTVRIPAEEKALAEVTNYREQFLIE
ncbi:isoprenylcysteine carboxyl methyltransferase family protein [Sporosarcina contaminans]|uniref:Isoprenylcysteine carboxyl methyltransferase family protein n=2 Tax=Sporosarcina TaxID=1569 RepID=A0ABW3U1L0_9BACL